VELLIIVVVADALTDRDNFTIRMQAHVPLGAYTRPQNHPMAFPTTGALAGTVTGAPPAAGTPLGSTAIVNGAVETTGLLIPFTTVQRSRSLDSAYPMY
jgi:hypothetical protein